MALAKFRSNYSYFGEVLFESQSFPCQSLLLSTTVLNDVEK